MMQRTLFPILRATPAAAPGAATSSCLDRIELLGGQRVLTTELLSSGEIRELVAASAERPVEARFRIPTPDRRLSEALEPGLPPPSMRFASLRAARRAGLACGVLVEPLVPGINDPECDLARLFDEARRSGAAFVECALARPSVARDRRLVRSLRDRYPRAAARLEVRRLTQPGEPGAERLRLEELLRRLEAASGVHLRISGASECAPSAERPGQRRFSFAV